MHTFLTMERSKGGIGNVFGVTDHFTQYLLAISTGSYPGNTTDPVRGVTELVPSRDGPGQLCYRASSQ